MNQRALEMGAVGWLRKPAPREELIAAIRRLESESSPRVRRLLIVEDDAVQRDSLRRLLGGQGIEIVAVDSVAAALAQLRGATFDCAVTDLQLADGTGFDLLEQMAADADLAFPPVIVYTGRSLDEDEEQRLRRYSSAIILKGARSPERLLDEVTLFLHQIVADLPPERQSMIHGVRDREAVFEGRTVLVVEDDVRNVFALTSILEPRGIRVVIARNGREALAALEKGGKLDLVLMDIMMPEMDGLEATRRLRADRRWADLPVIALTAKAMKDDREQCIAAGANDYISKPIDVEMLLSLMRVWISR
jgi:CheY-like chemotaxis protein